MRCARPSIRGPTLGPWASPAVMTLRGWSRVIVSIGLLLIGIGRLFAADVTPTEDQVKAAFLLNFPKYVEWPATSFTDSMSPVVLTVIGDKGVEKEVRRMAQGKLFHGRALDVRLVAGIEEIPADCQMLFVSLSDARKTAQIIASLGERSVLTIGEGEEFFECGGMIRLVRRDQKVRLAIHVPNAEGRGLKISSKLLSVADEVKRRGEAAKL